MQNIEQGPGIAECHPACLLRLCRCEEQSQGRCVGCEWLLLSKINSPVQVCSCRVQVSVAAARRGFDGRCNMEDWLQSWNVTRWAEDSSDYHMNSLYASWLTAM